LPSREERKPESQGQPPEAGTFCGSVADEYNDACEREDFFVQTDHRCEQKWIRHHQQQKCRAIKLRHAPENAEAHDKEKTVEKGNVEVCAENLCLDHGAQQVAPRIGARVLLLREIDRSNAAGVPIGCRICGNSGLNPEIRYRGDGLKEDAIRDDQIDDEEPNDQPYADWARSEETRWGDGRELRHSGAQTILPSHEQKRSIACAALSGWLARKNISQPADLCADSPKLLLNALIAAVDVIDAVEDSFTFGNHGRKDERSGSA
jgi:hypothetical protein